MDTQTRSSVQDSASPAASWRIFPTPVLIEIERMDEVCLLHCKGNFRTGENPEYLRLKMAEVSNLDCPKVLADFKEVPSVGALGVSFLVGLYRISGGCFVVVGTQPRVRQILDITRLSTLIPLAADIESGLAILRGGGCTAYQLSSPRVML